MSVASPKLLCYTCQVFFTQMKKASAINADPVDINVINPIIQQFSGCVIYLSTKILKGRC